MSSLGFLVLLLMISAERPQAIRLLSKTWTILPSLHYQVNQKRYSLFKEESGTQGVIRYGFPCGHCSGRKNRQLMATLDKGTSKNSVEKREQNPDEEKKSDFARNQKEIHPVPERHTYLDDNQQTVGMDYSPAQKKPPIHN
ncbi:uncharacterized protein LOC122008663 isoform X1 [Zingiber officinale]|uniref:uncharacterized protein LOC122008663 isoform X1 n=1 Tax=Zingiber officinale TaxID=94328 RepID=UPI001C4B64D1|nr:uncharacterized protein LOC122008663 isoform X1 [Zingiber officinale]